MAEGRRENEGGARSSRRGAAWRVARGVVLALLLIVLFLSAWHRFVVEPSTRNDVAAPTETEDLRQLRETTEELERVIKAAKAKAPAAASVGGKPSDVDSSP